MTAIATAAPTVLISRRAGISTDPHSPEEEVFIPYTSLGGKKGLEQIAALKPELIITDVRIPLSPVWTSSLRFAPTIRGGRDPEDRAASCTRNRRG